MIVGCCCIQPNQVAFILLDYFVGQFGTLNRIEPLTVINSLVPPPRLSVHWEGKNAERNADRGICEDSEQSQHTIKSRHGANHKLLWLHSAHILRTFM